jgi:hypothetical protein
MSITVDPAPLELGIRRKCQFGTLMISAFSLIFIGFGPILNLSSLGFVDVFQVQGFCYSAILFIGYNCTCKATKVASGRILREFKVYTTN